MHILAVEELTDLWEEFVELRDASRDEDDQERYEVLKALDENLWCGLETAANEYGLFLIHESWFEDYAQDFARSLGEIPDFLESYIDWEAFADGLKNDFTEVTYDGETHYMRQV